MGRSTRMTATTLVPRWSVSLCLFLLLPGLVLGANYCGTAFSAASACSHACPGGTDGECPSGQRCFASVTCGPPSAGSGNLYCGLTFASASACTHACPRGTNADCPFGQTCYASVTCGTPLTGGSGNRYCGPTFADATACEKACPLGTDAECGPGEKCFGEITCGGVRNQCGKGLECPLKACCSAFGHCGWTKEFCNKSCQSDCEFDVKPPSCDESKKSTVRWGYYASWAARRECYAVTPQKLKESTRDYTHLAFAFAHVSSSFELIPADEKDEPLYKEFTALKKDSPRLKTVIAVGGWAFNDPPTHNRFSNMAASRIGREKFISSSLGFMRKYGFDGLDIDWEYPGADDRGGSPRDFENYVLLVKELRQAFNQAKEDFSLTMAVPLSNWYMRHYDLPELAKHLDFFNVMSYDLHGVWDGNIPSLGPFVRAHTNMTEIKEGMKMFYKNEISPSQLVLGLGAYGRTWTLKDRGCSKPGCEFTRGGRAGECTGAEGFQGYFEIRKKETEEDYDHIQLDKESASMYMVQGDQWISYDNVETFRTKRDYAEGDCMRGTMIWSVDMISADPLPPKIRRPRPGEPAPDFKETSEKCIGGAVSQWKSRFNLKQVSKSLRGGCKLLRASLGGSPAFILHDLISNCMDVPYSMYVGASYEVGFLISYSRTTGIVIGSNGKEGCFSTKCGSLGFSLSATTGIVIGVMLSDDPAEMAGVGFAGSQDLIAVAGAGWAKGVSTSGICSIEISISLGGGVNLGSLSGCHTSVDIVN